MAVDDKDISNIPALLANSPAAAYRPRAATYPIGLHPLTSTSPRVGDAPTRPPGMFTAPACPSERPSIDSDPVGTPPQPSAPSTNPDAKILRQRTAPAVVGSSKAVNVENAAPSNWVKWQNSSCTLDSTLLVAYMIYRRVPIPPEQLSVAGKWFNAHFVDKHPTFMKITTRAATSARDIVRKLLETHKLPVRIDANTSVTSVLSTLLPKYLSTFNVAVHHRCKICGSEVTTHRLLEELGLKEIKDTVQGSLDRLVRSPPDGR